MDRFSTNSFFTGVLTVVCWLGFAPAAQADDFATDFEDTTDVNPARSFTITDGSLSVLFQGGTLFSAGVDDLYRSGVKSWMVDPLGVRLSTGNANAVLSEGATNVTLYGRTQSPAVIARVRVIDVDDVVLQDVDLNDSTWTRIDVTRGSGESLIGLIRVENMSGGTTNDLMAAIDDFEFSTDAASFGAGNDDDDSGGTTIGPLAFLLLSVAALVTRVRRRA